MGLVFWLKTLLIGMALAKSLTVLVPELGPAGKVEEPPGLSLTSLQRGTREKNEYLREDGKGRPRHVFHFMFLLSDWGALSGVIGVGILPSSNAVPSSARGRAGSQQMFHFPAPSDTRPSAFQERSLAFHRPPAPPWGQQLRPRCPGLRMTRTLCHSFSHRIAWARPKAAVGGERRVAAGRLSCSLDFEHPLGIGAWWKHSSYCLFGGLCMCPRMDRGHFN